MARWYAKQHLKTDPGIISVSYLPKNADDREIRLIEVNKLIGNRNDNALIPIDFGIDMGTDNAHTLLVLDVTPEQWKRIKSRKLGLPSNWSLDGEMQFTA